MATIKDKAKDLGTKAATNLLPFVPRFGMNMIVKKLRKKLIAHYDKNPEGLDERELRYKKYYALNMIDVFLSTTG